MVFYIIIWIIDFFYYTWFKLLILFIFAAFAFAFAFWSYADWVMSPLSIPFKVFLRQFLSILNKFCWIFLRIIYPLLFPYSFKFRSLVMAILLGLRHVLWLNCCCYFLFFIVVSCLVVSLRGISTVPHPLLVEPSSTSSDEIHCFDWIISICNVTRNVKRMDVENKDLKIKMKS